MPAIDQQSYAELAKRALAAILQVTWGIEFRANRNLLASPQVRTTTVWRTLADWAAAPERTEFQTLDTEFREFITNVMVKIWVPSAIPTEAVRPGK